MSERDLFKELIGFLELLDYKAEELVPGLIWFSGGEKRFNFYVEDSRDYMYGFIFSGKYFPSNPPITEENKASYLSFINELNRKLKITRVYISPEDNGGFIIKFNAWLPPIDNYINFIYLWRKDVFKLRLHLHLDPPDLEKGLFKLDQDE